MQVELAQVRNTMSHNTYIADTLMNYFELMSYLRYLCLFASSGVQHILCCDFFLYTSFNLKFPVYLDCSFLIAPS